MISMSQARDSWESYHKHKGFFATFEAFAENIGAVPDHKMPKPATAQAQRPAEAKPKVPAHLAGDMTGQFARALALHASQQPPTPPDPNAIHRAEWDADADLRAEFSDNFDRYLAYQGWLASKPHRRAHL